MKKKKSKKAKKIQNDAPKKEGQKNREIRKPHNDKTNPVGLSVSKKLSAIGITAQQSDKKLPGPVNTDISQVLPEGTYTGKEYIQFLKDSGIGDAVAAQLPTPQEQQMAKAMWNIIQMQNKLERPGPRVRISKEEEKFLSIKDKLPADALTGKLDVFVIYIEELGLRISRATAYKLWKKYRSS